MEKPDFSDIYKFKVSNGIIIFALGVALPWFFYTYNEILLVPQANINLLTPKAISVISIKQWVAEKSLIAVPILSILTFLVGGRFILSGLKEWKKRQKVLDDIQDYDLKLKKKSIEELNEEETSKKIKNEIIDNEGLEPDVIIPDIVNKVNQYRNIEKEAVSVIEQKYQNTYSIKSNCRIGSHEYDIIMSPKYFGQKMILVELKYYSHQIRYTNLIHGIRSFLLSIENFEKSAPDIPTTKISYYVVWIYTNDTQKPLLEKYLSLAHREIQKTNHEVKIVIIKETEISAVEIE